MSSDAGSAQTTEGNGILRATGSAGGLAWALRSEPGEVRPHNEDFGGVYVPRANAAPVIHGAADDRVTEINATAVSATQVSATATSSSETNSNETSAIETRAFETSPFFVICDGLGGHAAGEVASRLAVDAALRSWSERTTAVAHQAARTAARAANAAVYDGSLARGKRGMATTFTALCVEAGEAVVAHVGDSRAYLVRDGSCSQLTADHSRVAEMLRMGLITAQQASVHPGRSQLTRTVGSDMAVQVDIVRNPVRAGDVFVLCSDGLWDVVSRQEIADLVGITPTEPGCDLDDTASVMILADRLVSSAIERKSPDNVSVLVVGVTTEQPSTTRAGRWSRLRRSRG